ncbi:MAG: PEP-CTERM sorting domain-containing protein [Pirellulaceae bacterium]
MKALTVRFAAILAVVTMATAAQAAFIVNVDADGLDDGPVAYDAHFTFGGDTTTASSSVATTALYAGAGDSIFGGDGAALPDTYIYTYTPSVEGDNTAIPSGTHLGEGNIATGLPNGAKGLYNVYAAWPQTANVSGGLTQFTLQTLGSPDVVTQLDQNNRTQFNDDAGAPHDPWVYLGTVDYKLGAIVVIQEPSSANTFVSMRGAAVLYEKAPVPEPATGGLLVSALLALGTLRRRR